MENKFDIISGHGRGCYQCGQSFEPSSLAEMFCSKECFETHEGNRGLDARLRAVQDAKRLGDRMITEVDSPGAVWDDWALIAQLQRTGYYIAPSREIARRELNPEHNMQGVKKDGNPV